MIIRYQRGFAEPLNPELEILEHQQNVNPATELLYCQKEFPAICLGIQDGNGV